MKGDLPTSTELGIPADLWNALARRASVRSKGHALFSVRDRAVRIAVMALDAAIDGWVGGRNFDDVVPIGTGDGEMVEE